MYVKKKNLATYKTIQVSNKIIDDCDLNFKINHVCNTYLISILLLLHFF